MKLDKLIKQIQSHNKQLPTLDPYRVLQDWHTQNAMAFYGANFLKNVLDYGSKVFNLKQAYQEHNKENMSALKDKDSELKFNSGLQAVRGYFRKKAKSSGLGLMYGGGVGILVTNFQVAKAVGIRLFANFFSSLQILKAHLDTRVAEALNNHYVETLFGRRLYLPQLADYKYRNQGIRKVYNSPIQGTAGDLIKIFILKIGEWIEDFRLSKYEGNNIAKVVNGQHYNRIITIQQSKYNPKLAKKLKKLNNGHTRLLIVDKDNQVTKEYDRALNIPYGLFEEYRMQLIH